jgi:hypothetical protein
VWGFKDRLTVAQPKPLPSLVKDRFSLSQTACITVRAVSGQEGMQDANAVKQGLL